MISSCFSLYDNNVLWGDRTGETNVTAAFLFFKAACDFGFWWDLEDTGWGGKGEKGGAMMEHQKWF